MRSVRPKALVVCALAVALQVALWLLVGRNRMYSASPSMAEAIMAAYQRHAVKYHLDVNGRRPHLNLVVCDDLAKSLGASGVERLQRHLEPWDVAVFTRETAPPHFLAEKWKCDECQVFCVQSKFDSPLVGVAESSTWWGSLGANGFTNVTVFLMGFWIRVATWRSWVA